MIPQINSLLQCLNNKQKMKCKRDWNKRKYKFQGPGCKPRSSSSVPTRAIAALGRSPPHVEWRHGGDADKETSLATSSSLSPHSIPLSLSLLPRANPNATTAPRSSFAAG